jgi:hypothetical protein
VKVPCASRIDARPLRVAREGGRPKCPAAYMHPGICRRARDITTPIAERFGAH